MKKNFLISLSVLCLLIGIFYYISLPDYHIFNSTSFGSQSNRDTTLQVIVYKYWDIDELIREIEEEHNKINGTPATLEINLYYSRWHFLHGKEPFKTSMFKYQL